MSVQRHLISKILETQDLSAVADVGVTRAFFTEHEHRQAFDIILAHQSQYSQPPSIEAFQRDLPTYRITDCPDTIDYYANTLTTEYSSYILEDGMVEMYDAWDEDRPDEAKRAMSRTLDLLNQEITGSRVTDITQTGADRIEKYRAYARNKGILKGISTGFDSLDYATGGIQRKQLWTFVGPPKAGKSTIMLLAMMAAHRSFYKPLFIGFEMTNEEQEERHDAIRAHVSHKRLRDGNLSADEFAALERMSRRLEAMPPMIFSEDADSSLTVSGIASQVDKHGCDVVFVDGVYMMEDEHGQDKGSPQALTNITRSLKQLVKNKDIGGCLSTQVLTWKMDRKRGITGNSIGYTSSFAQDSDAVIGVMGTDDPTINKVSIVLARNASGMETFVHWDWDKGVFEELEDYDESEDPSADPKF